MYVIYYNKYYIIVYSFKIFIYFMYSYYFNFTLYFTCNMTIEND